MAIKRYEIVVRGEAAMTLHAAFPDFEVHRRSDTTVMEGSIADAMALEEIIAGILGLGLEIVEFREVQRAARPEATP